MSSKHTFFQSSSIDLLLTIYLTMYACIGANTAQGPPSNCTSAVGSSSLKQKPGNDHLGNPFSNDCDGSPWVHRWNISWRTCWPQVSFKISSSSLSSGAVFGSVAALSAIVTVHGQFIIFKYNIIKFTAPTYSTLNSKLRFNL